MIVHIICVTPGAFAPIGDIITWNNSNNIPTGYMVCDGSELACADYPELFELIGYAYGHFALEVPRKGPRWFWRLLRQPVMKTVPHPNAPREGYFRLPDMRYWRMVTKD